MPQSTIDHAMSLACELATKSPDPSSQTGAVLISEQGRVIGMGYNTFTTGIQPTLENLERPRKYRLIEHAERNAIYHAAKWGNQTLRSTMVSPWIGCTDCDRAIVAAGVQEIVRMPIDFGNDHWSENIALGDTILRAGGVTITEQRFEHLTLPLLRRNSQLVDPRHT